MFRAGVRNDVPFHWVWDLVRPVLSLRLWYFRRLVRTNLYLAPVKAAQSDCEADRVAHIGSTDAVRVGVTDDRLTTLSRIANTVSAERRRAFNWQYSGTQLLTARQAARHSMTEFTDVDVALIVLGFSDVLLMTSRPAFEHDLADLIAAFRRSAGESCGVVVTGLAPMDEFRYTARLGRHRIQQQVARLNNAMAIVASHTPACVYVPPPVFPRPAGRPGDEQYSWAMIHQLWGQAISPALLAFLNPSDRGTHD